MAVKGKGKGKDGKGKGKFGKGGKGHGDGKGGKGYNDWWGKGGTWWRNGVWAIYDQDEDVTWEWDKEDDEAGQVIAAVDYQVPEDLGQASCREDLDAEGTADRGGWRMARRGRRRTRPAAESSKMPIPGPDGGLHSIDRPVGGKSEVNQLTHGWERIRVQVDSGAIDTVAPKSVGRAFGMRETPMSKNNIGFVAANGSKITNFGERTVTGYTDDGEGVSMRMTCADVRKVLGSVHRMNRGGNRVVLDGDESYIESKQTGRQTKIHYEQGQYILYLWVPADSSEAGTVRHQTANGSRYAILAAEDEQGFARPARA